MANTESLLIAGNLCTAAHCVRARALRPCARSVRKSVVVDMLLLWEVLQVLGFLVFFNFERACIEFHGNVPT